MVINTVEDILNIIQNSFNSNNYSIVRIVGTQSFKGVFRDKEYTITFHSILDNGQILVVKDNFSPIPIYNLIENKVEVEFIDFLFQNKRRLGKWLK